MKGIDNDFNVWEDGHPNYEEDIPSYYDNEIDDETYRKALEFIDSLLKNED